MHIYQVQVVDRTAVVTANAETEVVKPPGIQEAIDSETGMQHISYLLLELASRMLYKRNVVVE